mmetsp:Transcript_118360/g.339717  ORF Transcript_118360/g.339717 Transcript_118360/m.339717 type:complete len:303 (-) Transcript_118360:107-1015(-)
MVASSTPHRAGTSKPSKLTPPTNSIKLRLPLRFTSRILVASSKLPTLKRRLSRSAPGPWRTTCSSRCAYSSALACKWATPTEPEPANFIRSKSSLRICAHGVPAHTLLNPPVLGLSLFGESATDDCASAADAWCTHSASADRYHRTKGSTSFAFCNQWHRSPTVSAICLNGIATRRPPFNKPNQASWCKSHSTPLWPREMSVGATVDTRAALFARARYADEASGEVILGKDGLEDDAPSPGSETQVWSICLCRSVCSMGWALYRMRMPLAWRGKECDTFATTSSDGRSRCIPTLLTVKSSLG